MPLTDPDGNAIPADDPRLPTEEATAAVVASNQAKVIRIRQMGADILPDILEVRAQMRALVSLMVPPDGPVRRLFDHRQREAEGLILDDILTDLHQARDKALGLQVAQAMPQPQASPLQVVKR